jgi:hypothetical protein
LRPGPREDDAESREGARRAHDGARGSASSTARPPCAKSLAEPASEVRLLRAASAFRG